MGTIQKWIGERRGEGGGKEREGGRIVIREGGSGGREREQGKEKGKGKRERERGRGRRKEKEEGKREVHTVAFLDSVIERIHRE